MKDYTWPYLVKEKAQKQLSPENIELLDELEDHLDVPVRGITEPNDDVLAGWLLQAIAEKKITEPEFSMLRSRLLLEEVLPKKIVMVHNQTDLIRVTEEVLKGQLDDLP